MTIVLLVAVIAAIIIITAVWKIHPLPVLLLGGFAFGICSRFGVLETLNMLSAGFGNTIKSIGIVIIAGTVIGCFMEQRGALKVIAEKIIALTGEKRTPLAMAIIGYVVSICIFCDSAFIILIGLWKKIGTLAKLPLAVGAAAQKLSYSAVVRNSANELVANTNLTVAISIANSNGGPAVYSETHSGVQTNQNGLLTLVIGAGGSQA